VYYVVVLEKPFWYNIFRAVEAEPKPVTSIRGASGIVHDVVAAGVDESRRRLLVVSGEHDARTAAMAQIDIQAALEHTQVLVARPIALDFTLIAKSIVQFTGQTSFNLNALSTQIKPGGGLPSPLDAVLEQSLAPLKYLPRIPLNVLAQFMHSLQQLAYLNFNMTEPGDGAASEMIIDLQRLTALDPLEGDNHFGVCPVPLYTFSTDEVERLSGDPNLDEVRELLRRHDILQYFFPAADQLALGFVDRGSDTTTKSVLDQLELAPQVGHPYGQLELLPSTTTIADIVDSLQERGLIVEGEVGLEMGPSGRQIRTSLKFKPREGVVSKIINRFSFNFDLKNLLGPK
jgi:hypothetical protein